MINKEESYKSGNLPIKVSKEVVGHLSIGLYRNFARAIKELVSNCYDAGARDCWIKLDLAKGRIIVRDNGHGMDITDMEKYLHIGFRTDISDKTDDLGRKRIGTFGIGFLSVFPYCTELIVTSKKRGENPIVELQIDTQQFFDKNSYLVNIEEALVPYMQYPSDLPIDKGETIIILQGIKPHIIDELRQQSKKDKSSIDRYSGFEKFRWTLSQYAPIEFSDNYSILKSFFTIKNVVTMRLWLDGIQLFRNVPKGSQVLEKDEKRFGDVKLKYALLTTMAPIEPEEARGIQIRVRNVAIGLPRDFDVVKLEGRVLGKLNYLYGEAHILSGLESAIMIDRDSFSYTQDVADIYDFFRNLFTRWNGRLENWATEDRNLYQSLQDIAGIKNVIDELKKQNVIRFSKERLRVPKANRLETKQGEVLPVSQKIAKALSRKRDFNIVTNKSSVSSKRSPIEVAGDNKTITIYEKHEVFEEKLDFRGTTYKVEYERWDPKAEPYSICRLVNRNIVQFNREHPIFRSRLNEDIIKRLSLGILLLTKEHKEALSLLHQLNQLIEETFTGR